MIGLNYGVEINPDIDYTLDTIFKALGVPYKKIHKFSKIDPEAIPLVLTHGNYQLPDELLTYVKKGGHLINIPNHELIKKNEKLLKEKGYKTKISHKFKLSGYLNSGKIRDMPVFSPLFFTTEKPVEKVELKFVEPSELKNKYCISYSRYYDGLLINIGFDLIYSIFYILSCKHEIDKNQIDRYNRVNESNNLLLENHKETDPWVNLYILFLETLIKYIYTIKKLPLIKKWYWPGNAEFAVWLSHDVDEVKKYTVKKSVMSLMNRKVGDSVSGLGKSFKGADKDPYWSFAKIIDLENELGFVSTFFFGSLTGSIRKISDREDNIRGVEIAYNIDNNNIQNLIKYIVSKGWEVGLHGSYGSFKNKKRLKAEKEIMEKSTGIKCNGIRQHYLRWKSPETWRIQESCGLNYDSTLGFSTAAGFKPGYLFPYNIYNTIEHKPFKLVELPLMIPDSGMAEGSKTANEKIVNQIISEVKKYNGLITVLFHNDRFSKTEVTSSEKMYKKILIMLKDNKIFNDTGIGIVEWWRSRDNAVWKDVELSNSGRYTWTIKSSGTIHKLTIKIQVPLEMLDNFKLKISPQVKIISQVTGKRIDIGTITFTIDKLVKDKVYKIIITK
jgi:hypothetical protein